MEPTKVIKAECTPEFKDKLRQFIKKKGETEAAIVRKAIQNYMATPAPKQP